MILYQSPYLILDWTESQKLAIVEWFEASIDLTQETFFQEISHIHAIIEEKKPLYLLGQDTHFKFAIPVELQEGALKATITRMNTIGVKKFAHVLSSELIARLSLELTFEENTERTYQDKSFDSVEAAHRWLNE